MENYVMEILGGMDIVLLVSKSKQLLIYLTKTSSNNGFWYNLNWLPKYIRGILSSSMVHELITSLLYVVLTSYGPKQWVLNLALEYLNLVSYKTSLS